MRLLFGARALDRMAGGVERMIISLMNDMVARGHEVNLLTWDRSGSEKKEMTPASVPGCPLLSSSFSLASNL